MAMFLAIGSTLFAQGNGLQGINDATIMLSIQLCTVLLIIYSN